MKDEVTDISNWTTAREAWESFCQRNPMFGYSGNQCTFIHFVRSYAEKMVAAGAMRLTTRKRWLADKSKFDKAAFDVLTFVPTIEGGRVQKKRPAEKVAA